MTRSDAPRRHAVHGIIVGHAGLPEALLGAASAILGEIDGISTLSNSGLSAAELEERLGKLVKCQPAERFIIFVDMFGSSCSTASIKLQQRHREVAVVCGANLPMLIRFVGHRDRDSFDELVDQVRAARGSEPPIRADRQ